LKDFEKKEGTGGRIKAPKGGSKAGVFKNAQKEKTRKESEKRELVSQLPTFASKKFCSKSGGGYSERGPQKLPGKRNWVLRGLGISSKASLRKIEIKS